MARVREYLEAYDRQLRTDGQTPGTNVLVMVTVIWCVDLCSMARTTS